MVPAARAELANEKSNWLATKSTETSCLSGTCARAWQYAVGVAGCNQFETDGMSVMAASNYLADKLSTSPSTSCEENSKIPNVCSRDGCKCTFKLPTIGPSTWRNFDTISVLHWGKPPPEVGGGHLCLKLSWDPPCKLPMSQSMSTIKASKLSSLAFVRSAWSSRVDCHWVQALAHSIAERTLILPLPNFTGKTLVKEQTTTLHGKCTCRGEDLCPRALARRPGNWELADHQSMRLTFTYLHCHWSHIIAEVCLWLPNAFRAKGIRIGIKGPLCLNGNKSVSVMDELQIILVPQATSTSSS